MGLSIGEMFVELGIEGADKTLGALSEVKNRIGLLGDTSLEAKAAIVGAFYWLEQLFSKSNAVGQGLSNFTKLTGESSTILQKYQYALRQVGASNEDTANTFKHLQDVVAQAKLGLGVPKGLFAIAQTVGITQAEFDKALKSPEALLQKLHEFAVKSKQLGISEGIRNQFLRSFNLSDDMIAALSTKGALAQKVLNQAPIYSDAQVSQLQKANVAWGNLAQKIDMAVGHLNAKHGLTLITDINKLTDAFLKLCDVLLTLSERMKVIKGIGNVFSGWTQILELLSHTGDAKWGAAADADLKDLLKGNGGYSNDKYIPGYMDRHVNVGGVTVIMQYDGKINEQNIKKAHKEAAHAAHQSHAIAAVS